MIDSRLRCSAGPAVLRRLTPLLIVVVATVAPRHLAAQWMMAPGTGDNGALGAPVGSDLERYIRALMVANAVVMVPWSTRALSAADLEKLLVSPDTSSRLGVWHGITDRTRGLRLLAPSAFASWNSGYPWGANNASIAAGRGATTAVGVGVSVRYGPVTAILAPSFSATQNSAFPLLDNGQTGAGRFRDGLLPEFVDRPQRFGDRAFTTIDLGQSQIRVDLKHVTFGAGTQNIGWGTSEQFAPILGPNAPGFAHAFIGTRASGFHLDDIGTIAVRYVSGRLEQSSFSPVSGSRTFQSAEQPGTARLATGLALSWMPAFVPQLELGATRLFISPFFPGSRKWRTLRKPIDGLFKASRTRSSESPGDELGDLDNQLGTLYARLRLPKRGAEFSLEWLREDNSFDSRDLVQEPEQNAAIVAGFRVATQRSARCLGMLTAEWFDGDISPIGRQRDQGNLYIHIPLRQGATHRGQLLGAPIGVGAISGQRLEWERFDSTGSWRIGAERWNRRFQRLTSIGSLVYDATRRIPNSRETAFDVGVTRLIRRKRGPALSLAAGLGMTEAFNFSDRRFNARLSAGLRGW